MRLMIIGHNLEMFTEGYSRVFLRFCETVAHNVNLDEALVININRYNIPLLTVLKSLAPKLVNVSRIIEFKDLNIMSIAINHIIEFMYTNSLRPEIIFFGPFRSHLHIELLLRVLKERFIRKNYSMKMVTIINSLKHLREFLSATRTLRIGLLNEAKIYVLNPFVDADYRNVRFVRTYPPPVDPTFTEIIGLTMPRLADMSKTIFRFMGRIRLRDESTLILVLQAFRLFTKMLGDHAEVELVIDAFREDVSEPLIMQSSKVKVVVDNPLIHVKRGSKPLKVVWSTFKKYMKSSYVLLPYRVEQFIHPPLTLLEALALGVPVLASDLVTKWFPHKDFVIKINSNYSVEELAKILKHLYDVYGNSQYYQLSVRAIERLNAMFRETVEAIKRILRE